MANAWIIGLLGGLLVGLVGCFVDQPSGVDRICPTGEDTCRCFDDARCAAGLMCQDDGRCRDPRCVSGNRGCACIDGERCDEGLVCLDSSCLPPGDGSGSDSSVAEVGPPVMTSTMTSGPETSPGTDSSPGTLSDDTTGPPTGMTEGVTGPLTVGMEGSFVVDPTGSTQCSCGWAGRYYDCGYAGAIDPAGAYPYNCPDTAEQHAGDLCDATVPPVGFLGCCVAETGALVWCDGTAIVLTECCY